jgi:hypothetical protein
LDFRALCADSTRGPLSYPRRVPLSVSVSGHRFLEPTVPRFLRNGFILSCPLLLFGVSSPVLLASSFRGGLSCRGFVPLRGVTGGVHLARELSFSHYVPSSGFLNLSTVCATFQRRGLIASRSHVQGFPFRGFSRSTGGPTRHRPVPPCRFHPRARRLASCHASMVRLRGLAPWCDAFRRVGD